MRVVKFVVLSAFLSFFSLGLGAQGREIAVSAGGNVPMYDDTGSDAMLGVDYSWFKRSGLGFRAGLQWTESFADIDNSFGMPIAVVYRTHTLDSSQRLLNGAIGAADAAWYGDSFLGVIGAFLVNLISDFDFFAGVTPGYTAGASSFPSRELFAGGWEEDWTEKRRDFSLSLDAGFSLNYRIWRFRLKLVPAFHYNLVGNAVYRYQEVLDTADGPEVVASEYKPLRWVFTFNGSLAFAF